MMISYEDADKLYRAYVKQQEAYDEYYDASRGAINLVDDERFTALLTAVENFLDKELGDNELFTWWFYDTDAGRRDMSMTIDGEKYRLKTFRELYDFCKKGENKDDDKQGTT